MTSDPVQARLDARSTHDVDAFAACYAAEVTTCDATGARVATAD
jgi:hypothetical protein